MPPLGWASASQRRHPWHACPQAQSPPPSLSAQSAPPACLAQRAVKSLRPSLQSVPWHRLPTGGASLDNGETMPLADLMKASRLSPCLWRHLQPPSRGFPRSASLSALLAQRLSGPGKPLALLPSAICSSLSSLHTQLLLPLLPGDF